MRYNPDVYEPEAMKEIIGRFNSLIEEKGVDTNDLLDNGKIYYMNANDGTDFDWCMNNRTCEFMMFYKETNLGFAKLMVNKEGSIDGYIWADEGRAQGKPIETKNRISPSEAKEFCRLMYTIADRKFLYDEPIDNLDINYERKPEWLPCELVEDDEEDEEYDY